MIYVLVVVLIIALGILWIFNLALSRKHALSPVDVQRIQSQWTQIEQMAGSGNDADILRAVLEADKLLDFALTCKRVSGDSVADKLKAGKHLFRNVQLAWDAHKYRNRIAHEMGHSVNRNEAMRAIEQFKQCLRDLQAV